MANETSSQNPLPPIGMVLGPYPPCSICGSDGYPADIEVTVKGKTAWTCMDCFFKHMPPSVVSASKLDNAKARRRILAERDIKWSRSWRGWKRRSREDADEQPTLFVPGS